jgi:tetratricopeptide (TPR) repeat protein
VSKSSAWCRWLLVLVLVPLAASFGCNKSSASRGPGGNQQETRQTRRDDLFKYAIANLNQLEEYDTSEMLRQAVDRLSQWVQEQPPLADWKPDPLIASLPKAYADLPVLQGLDKREFSVQSPASDGQALQEAVLLRDVANWARADQVEDLPRAKELFDWTVRNIQLQPEMVDAQGNSARVMQTPWETLLLGRGSAAERAWVFVLLARQQGIDAAVVMPAELAEPARQGLGPWLVGVLSQGELYLFDPSLGLPIPAPNGKKLGERGQLAIEPATLKQVAADDALLRQLDADLEHPYPLKAAQMKRVVALLEASPASLSQRMRLLESKLAGEDRLVLTTDPSAQAERFKKCEHVADARLWLRPYQTIEQEIAWGERRAQWLVFSLMPFQIGMGNTPALYKGRLYHLKGRLTGSPCAAEFYQMARLSNRQIASANVSPDAKAIYVRAKLDASFWLGLIAAYQDNPRSAIDYFDTRTLDLVPDNLWTHGAKYNLARVYEATKRYAEAIELYRGDTQSPSYQGNILRARWLESLSPKAPPKSK